MAMKSTVPNTLIFLFACFWLLVNVPQQIAQENPATKPAAEIRQAINRLFLRSFV